MGKVTLILAVLFITILISFFIHFSENPPIVAELSSDNVERSNARNISNFALQYGIQQLLDGNVTFADSTHGMINDFSSFRSLEGYVDSIKFSNNTTTGTITIESFSRVGKYRHRSSAEIEIVLGTDALSNITAAIVTGGNITLKAKSVITGDIHVETELNFDEILGMTRENLIAHAQSIGAYFVNPPNSQAMTDSLMWVDGNFKITNNWTGSGILIVDGDLDVAAQMEFDGILIVFGHLNMAAFSSITGAVFIIGDETSTLSSHSEIVFDAQVVSSSFSSLPSNASYKILYWRE
ncbi:MAG: hypothetical protein J7K89_09045 [Candidatus Cloacimonetes bacterium]|nr:hypothetical protein [Candidatus Cloacimonadota bacterium]